MSTKIYDGFVIEKMGWEALHRSLFRFRTFLRKRITHDLANSLACALAEDLDFKFYQGQEIPEDYCPALFVVEKFTREWKENPITLDLILSPHRGEIYGTIFGDSKYKELWTRKKFVHEYRYWDNTDRPSHLSEREWEQRALTWDRIIGDRTWAMSGFLAQCIELYFMPPRLEKVIAALPSFDDRSIRIARRMVFHHEFQRRSATLPVGESPVFGVSLVNQIWVWLNTDEGQKVLEVELEKVQRVLPREIPAAILQGGPSLRESSEEPTS